MMIFLRYCPISSDLDLYESRKSILRSDYFFSILYIYFAFLTISHNDKFTIWTVSFNH